MSRTPISFVHEVPDHCDRIVWRKNYYALPIADLAAAQQEIARLRAALEAVKHDLICMVDQETFDRLHPIVEKALEPTK